LRRVQEVHRMVLRLVLQVHRLCLLLLVKMHRLLPLHSAPAKRPFRQPSQPRVRMCRHDPRQLDAGIEPGAPRAPLRRAARAFAA
jgi:hypothetical protein